MLVNFWCECIKGHLEKSRNRTALITEEKSITWSELDRGLLELDQVISPAEHGPVLICCPRSSSLLMGMVWSLSRGFPAATIERNTMAVNLSRIASALGPHILLLHKADVDGFHELLKETGYKLPGVKITGKYWTDSLLGELVVIRFGDQKNSICPESCGWILRTSGSTGNPKMVMIGKEDLVLRATGEARDYLINVEDVSFNLLPFSHDVGFNQFLVSLYSGAQLQLMRAPSSKKFLSNLADMRITVAVGTPLLWTQFLNRAQEGIEYKSVKRLSISGGVLPVAKVEQLQRYFPSATIYRTYGQTETFRSLMATTKPGEAVIQTHGNPLSGVSLELLGENGERIIGDGEGLLQHSGDGTLLGYYPHVNKEKQVRTGDYFRRDINGQYFFLGRKDDLIKRWEERMYLSEAELTLLELPYVSIACALSRPVEHDRGNELVCFVVIKSNTDSEITETGLLNHCKLRLEPYKVPEKIFFLVKLPETLSGKIDRQALREYWDQLDLNGEGAI